MATIEAAKRPAGRLSRRALVGAAATAVVGWSGHAGAGQETPAGGQGRPATPVAATPIATPVANSAVPSALTVVTEQRPSYDGTPVAGGTLRLIRPPADLENFNPAAFRQDFQVAASYLD